MSEYPVLLNAPITEALLDIQVALPSDINLPALATMQEAIKDRFPNRRENKLFEFSLHAGESGDPQLTEPVGGSQGFLFDTADGKKTVQARLNGYTFNKMKPYESWEAFRDEARDLWHHYLKSARPITVTRTALRYINRIELPLPFQDFKEYILTVPEVAPGIPQALGSFFMRLMIPTPDERITAIITEAMDPIAQRQEKVTIIMDIDVFKEQTYDPHSEEIWDVFEALRQLKDTIFFNSLTDKAKELFK